MEITHISQVGPNMQRQPAVAGYFYPGTRAELEQQLSELIPEREKVRADAIVVPHAGYIYSGAVAGEVYASVKLPETFIILCPNHTGYGSDFDVYPGGEWLTPLGTAYVDQELVDELIKRFPRATKDGRAHAREHSLEVQIPFLQYLKGDIRFLPICVRQMRYQYLEELGQAVADIVQTFRREILVISSTDMTHYESQESANRKDRLAIQQMEQLNARGLYDTIHNYEISMCGYLPTTSTLVSAKQLGCKKGTLIKYATSGDVTHDYQSVVGYAGMVLS
jgi:AmmeMemoRadiSam system protein B